MSDEHLISQLKQRDRTALKSVYLDYKTEFFKFCSRYNAGEEILEDIFQDAIIALYENASAGKMDHLRSSVKTYLFGIGKFMLFKHFRKRKKEVFSDQEYVFDQHEEEIIRDVYEDSGLNAYHQQMVDSFKKLGDKCRKILELFYLEGLKLDEIVKVQGYENKNVAKSQKSRCLKSLKELISKANG